MTDVTKLPTASPSYYTIRKVKGGWAVQLVTPPLRTSIAMSGDRDQAIAYGQDAAARTHRPFKLGRTNA